MCWKERERQRFQIKDYQRIPLGEKSHRLRLEMEYPLHFPHVDPDNPALLSFTVHPEQGEKDAHASMKPGKYLKKYAYWMNDEEIEEYTVAWSNDNFPHELKLSKNGDESEEITVNGPRTCMQNCHYNGVHAHQVYSPEDGTDLTIAYIGEIESPRAFSIVWPEKKYFTNWYGDKRILNSLERAGYTQGPFEGSTILWIEENGETILPYIDQAPYVSERGDFLVLGNQGDYGTKTESGIADGKTCHSCGESMNEDESIHHGGEVWCSDCFHEHYSTCEYCEEYYSHENGGGYVEDSCLCEYCYEEHTADCAKSGERYFKENMHEICDEDGDGTGDYIHPDNIPNSDYEIMEEDGKVYHLDSLAITEEGDIIFKEEAGECARTGQIHPLEDLTMAEDGRLYCDEAIHDGQGELFA